MGKRQLTLEERLQQAFSLHGNKFDYSLWPNSVTANTRVDTICPIHGVFNQRLAEHCVTGKGCASCGGVKKLSKEQRVAQAVLKHGNKYDYSLLPDSINVKSTVPIRCLVHGVFNQKLRDHIHSGAGCPQCSDTQVSREDKIKKAKEIHGDKYDYSMLPFTLNFKTKYSIKCPIHGVFDQTLNNHIRLKHGCSSCTQNGFSEGLTAYLYFIRSEEGLVKIGISNDYVPRLKKLHRNTPFTFETLAVFKHEDGREVRKLEKYLHKEFPSANKKGFDGATEWLHLKTLDILDLPLMLGFTREL